MFKGILFCALLLAFLSTQCSASVTRKIDPETQLKSWKLHEGTFSLEIIQRLPDQTRAFFQARGFSRIIANDIATQCVLQAIGKNTSTIEQDQSISYALHDWKISVDSSSRKIKLKEQWNREWSDGQVSPASRVAFRWATFPTQQDFEPGGDYNWGMISFGLPPDTTFDLQVVWDQNGTTQNQWIRQIECPADR